MTRGGRMERGSTQVGHDGGTWLHQNDGGCEWATISFLCPSNRAFSGRGLGNVRYAMRRAVGRRTLACFSPSHDRGAALWLLVPSDLIKVFQLWGPASKSYFLCQLVECNRLHLSLFLSLLYGNMDCCSFVLVLFSAEEGVLMNTECNMTAKEDPFPRWEGLFF